MVKAMYAGVAGLKAHQSKMDVISNNIANVNTWGYKSMDTSFKESIYQTVSRGSGGSTANGGLGGTNPAMVGYGSMVSTISSNFTKGTQVPTGQPLDMFIDGTGFFVVGPMFNEGESQSPENLSLTRVGDFKVINGYLVDGNGRYVYGFSMETGGEVYAPVPKVTQTEELVIIPTKGLPAGTTKPGPNGSTVTIKYEANPQNNGYMIVTTTTTETKIAADFVPGLTRPTSDEDLDTLVRQLNEITPTTGPTLRYTLSEDKTMVTVTSSTQPAAASGILTGDLNQGGHDLTTTAGVLAAVNAANLLSPPDKLANVRYEAVGTDVIVHTTAAPVSSRGNSDTSPATDPGVKGATDGSTRDAIELALQAATGNGITFVVDPTDKNKVTRQKVEVDRTQEIPRPKPKKETLADGTVIVTSYEDNKIKDGKAKMVITTTVPVSPDDEFKGPEFDDGRMIMDADGVYSMTAGVGTLKPLKLPTTCTYFDENGIEQTEVDPILESISINANGMIFGTSKGTNESYLLGAVALANVTNPGGMMKGDGPYYSPSSSSGTPTISTASGASGELRGEFLESANVDIATEFSGMITTQRGFQANSKIITVSDEMLQELVNMKR